MASSGASTRSPARTPSATWRPAIKSVPSLQLPHKVLVNYLTSGHGYDNESTAALVREGNKFFNERQLEKAAEVFGAAYEISRLHYVYPALLHDVIMRRVLCLFMLGELKRAVFEAEMVLQVVPHAPTMYLMCGILYAVMHRTDDANLAFQHAVEQCRLLRDLVACIVALFAQARGHCDHTIEICTEVLERTPKFPAALLTRYYAYSSHASGHFSKQAGSDVASLLELNPNAAQLAAQRFSFTNHRHTVELVLHFHPWLLQEAPRPYEEYPVYSQRQPFLTVSLVLLAIAKLKTLVRSSRLVRSVCQKHQELVQQRAVAEKRMQELVEAQRNFSNLEQHAEVWGPADPEHAYVRKYRRYWMERPANFPQRDSFPFTQPLSLEKMRAVSGDQHPEECSVRSTGSTSLPEPPSGVSDDRLPARTPAESNTWAQPRAASESNPAQESAPEATMRPEELPHGQKSHSAAPPSMLSHPPAPSSSRPVKSLDQPERALPPQPPPHASGLSATANNMPPPLKSQARPPPADISSVPDPSRLMETLRCSMDTADTPTMEYAQYQSESMFASPALIAAANSKSRNRNSGGPALQSISMPPLQKVPKDLPPPPLIGDSWSQRDWLLKGLELADGFHNGETSPDLLAVATCQVPQLPEHEPCRIHSPPTRCSLFRRNLEGDENLMKAIEREGFDAFPDWFAALDRIYEITDMQTVKQSPEPFVGDAHRAGAPGLSYLVPKSPTQSKEMREESRIEVHEALMARYQDRILVTSLPNKAL